MSIVMYYPGGYEGAAAAQNKAEQWDDATQTYTAWDTSGNVTQTRPYTTAEAATLQAQQLKASLVVNQTTIQANVTAHMATISAWIAANPSGAVLTAAQTLVLAKLMYGIGLIINQQFGSTTGS